MIKIDGVTLSYQSSNIENLVLDHINLNIHQGDFVVLLGPSGCGKTSLLNILAGFLEASSGQVYMNNEVIKGPSKSRGVVFQSTNLFPWLNVYDNVAYGLKINGMSFEKYDPLVKSYLEEVDLIKYHQHYPHELSGGMKQRVALVRSLINQPKLLLLDEPFAALDALTRVQMQSLLRNIWMNSQQTFFLITHDIDEALSLANRIIVMGKDPGKILQEFKVNFNEKIEKNKNYEYYLDSNYMKVKQNILSLIE